MGARDEFARFVEWLNVYVVERQRQVCSAFGGAAHWCQWQDREIVATSRLIGEYDDMLIANHARYNPVDWHIGIIGTAPIFVLDDIKPEQLRRIQDELGIAATVETSPNNYQVWIKLTGEDYLQWHVWRAVRRYLMRQYNADPGAGGARHMFRLPIQGLYSHKRANPYPMKVTFEAASKATTKDVLAQIPVNELQRELEQSKPKTITRKKTRGGAKTRGRANIPEWFATKWVQRRENILSGANCPRRPDGTPDQSTIDFRLALQTLRGYQKRDAETKARIQEMVLSAVENEAESRDKPQPENYAQLTVDKAVEIIDNEPEPVR